LKLAKIEAQAHPLQMPTRIY